MKYNVYIEIRSPIPATTMEGHQMVMTTANRDKLKSVIAYIAERTRPGKVKLFKLLFFADFSARAELGNSITGEMYENFEMGPVPVTLWREFAAITSECVTITLVETGAFKEQKMAPRADFKIDLTDDERSVIDTVLSRYGDMSGTQLKHLAHQSIPYRASQRGDTIPYGLAAYLDYRKPTQDDVNALVKDDALMADIRRALAQAVAA